MFFDREKLVRAILSRNPQEVRTLVERHGQKILNRRGLPVTTEITGRRPGDEWMGRIYKKPASLPFALHHADGEMVEMLVTLGADVAGRIDHNYPTALFVAAALGRDDVLAGWLARYPDLAQARNSDDDSLLHIAAMHGQPRVLSLLLRTGAYDLHAASNSGSTPLAYAAKSGSAACITLLQKAAQGAQAAPAGPAPLVAGWHRIDDDSIAHVQDEAAIGYRLTEIFNFRTQELTRLRRNLATNAESMAVTAFAQVPDPGHIAEAARVLGRDAGPGLKLGLGKRPQ